jgi:Mysoin-binding motif of peroxisomes
MIIASNLLGEHTGAGSIRLEPTNKDSTLPELHSEWNLDGVALTLGITASLSWLLSWVATRPHILKFAALSLVMAVLLLILDASRGRQQLQALRQEAIQSAKAVVSNFRALDSSSSAAIVMIQEVEAISRGYHL